MEAGAHGVPYGPRVSHPTDQFCRLACRIHVNRLGEMVLCVGFTDNLVLYSCRAGNELSNNTKFLRIG